MCPVCIASAALIAAGVMSTGGLTALAAKKFHPTNIATETRWFDSQSHKDVNTRADVRGKEQL
jgi:hypothetical protein